MHAIRYRQYRGSEAQGGFPGSNPIAPHHKSLVDLISVKYLERGRHAWVHSHVHLMFSHGVGQSKTREAVTKKSLIRYVSIDCRIGSRTYADIVAERQRKFTFTLIYPYLLLIKQDIPSSQGYLSDTACWAPFAIHCPQNARCVCVCLC